MVEYEFRRASRVCSAENRPLQPGEAFVSALVELPDGSLMRVDTAAASWKGPPEDCVGWWRCRMPDLQRGKVHWAPPEILLAAFQHALSSGRTDVAWVMALLLMRKRILLGRGDDLRPGEGLAVIEPRSKQEYRILETEIAPDRIEAIQRELEEKLFTDVAANEAFDEEPAE